MPKLDDKSPQAFGISSFKNTISGTNDALSEILSTNYVAIIDFNKSVSNIVDDIDKLKVCYKPSPSATKENAITSLSSDFRTFGNPDPDRPSHRISGAPMTKENGIEFRIFDHFSDELVNSLIRFILYIAENSRKHKTNGYVYKNKIWIENLQNIMK